jgi:acyl-CoA synthetase (AMP-forming)/AMP-acid ligase II
VKDAGVTGVPDEAAGELPLAFVVKQPEANVTKEELITYVAG